MKIERDPFAPPAALVSTTVFSVPRDTLLVEIRRSLEATDAEAWILPALEILLSEARARVRYCDSCSRSVWTRVDEALSLAHPELARKPLSAILASIEQTHPDRAGDIESALTEWVSVPLVIDAPGPLCPWCEGRLQDHRADYCPGCGMG